MLKAAIKHSSGEDQVRHRIVPTEILQNWIEKLAGFTEEIAAILKEEKEEKHACHILFATRTSCTNQSLDAKSRDGVEERSKHD